MTCADEARADLARVTAERDEAIAWIGVVRDELVIAGEPPGDRTVPLASLRTLIRERDAARVEVEEMRRILAALLLRVVETPVACGGTGAAHGRGDPVRHDAHSDACDACHEAIAISESDVASLARALLARPPAVAALRARETLAALAWCEAQLAVHAVTGRSAEYEIDRAAHAHDAWVYAREAREKAERAEEKKP